jgi:predicted nucleotidyltransferase
MSLLTQYNLAPAVIDRLVRKLQSWLPDLLVVYGFGSRVQGTAGPGSDLDMAVLVAGYADPVLLWQWSGELADVAGCAVDLLDLRAASTVMQYQIITTGVRWWALDVQAALFESAILSQKTALDTARAGLLTDIQQRGSVYGR